jgi:hypothetical protein
MASCRAVCRAVGMLALGLACAGTARAGQAEMAAANACAAGLPKDAKTIFDATLPKVGPGIELKSVVTSTTRSLAMSGAIERDTARESATEAGACLKKAAP